MELDDVCLPLRIATAEITRICNALELTITSLPMASRAVRSASPDLPSQADDLKLAEAAKALIRQRERRSKYFSNTELGEPMWDMLLDLFVSKLTGRQISISSACLASGVPPTTALRYLSQMTRCGMVNRLEHNSDRRRVYVELSAEMTGAMKAYLLTELGL